MYTSQLEEMCEKLGFIGKSASRIKQDNSTASRPIISGFTSVLVSKRGQRFVRIKLRKGYADYVRFKPDNTCYKLFVKCL